MKLRVCAAAWPPFASLLVMSGLASATAMAQAPHIAALDPAIGRSRALVTIAGANLAKARVVWDAGQPSERVLASNMAGADMFSVPAGASAGMHLVAVEGRHGRSQPVPFQVSGEPAPNATPRVDDIILINTRFEADGMVRTILYVQGANIDVGATVLVDGAVHASEAHKALRNSLLAANRAVLWYPIRHYLSRVVPLEPRPADSEIVVRIENEGGEVSGERRYRLPRDAATLDSDGDGIRDAVETRGLFDNGYGKGAVDIRALGADPFRKDIFVELDVMGGLDYSPEPEVFARVRRMFAAAPLINPFGPNGINLQVDPSGTVEYWDFIDIWLPDHSPKTRTASFAALKKRYFTQARRGLFHYAIWARADINDYSGYSNIDFDSTGVGDGFYVSFDTFALSYQTVTSKAATFAHELGHDLGQRHGGDTHYEFTPNYWSVMSYAWQLRTGHNDTFRKDHPTCTQIYYGVPGASEVNGAMPAVAGTRLDYSEGMGPTLVGDNQSLDETSGVCGQPIDWNGNGNIGEHNVNSGSDWCDVGDSSCHPRGPASDFPNWASLSLLGPVLGGAGPSGGGGGITTVSSSGAGARIAQSDEDASALSRRLEQQPAFEARRPVVSSDAGRGPSPAENAAKLRRVQQLLSSIERDRGLAPGTVTVNRVLGGSVTLQYDVQKLRDASSKHIAPPFSADIVTDATRPYVETVGELEYRSTRAAHQVDEVVALKAGREVAVQAFRSGDTVASLEMKGVLSARQSDGPGPELPVLVTVGRESRELRTGNVARLGNLEVRILKSSNNRARAHREGPPYVLRLEAYSIRPSP
jgi:hypothetical protein